MVQYCAKFHRYTFLWHRTIIPSVDGNTCRFPVNSVLYVYKNTFQAHGSRIALPMALCNIYNCALVSLLLIPHYADKPIALLHHYHDSMMEQCVMQRMPINSTVCTEQMTHSVWIALLIHCTWWTWFDYNWSCDAFSHWGLQHSRRNTTRERSEATHCCCCCFSWWNVF